MRQGGKRIIKKPQAIAMPGKEARQNGLMNLIMAGAALVMVFIALNAYAAGTSSSSNDTNTAAKPSGYFAAQKLAKAGDYAAALPAFIKLAEQAPKDADIQNYLGFVNRKMGQFEAAAIYYEKALALDPKHKGALAYQGELFLGLGQMDKAEANLAKLKKICFLGCTAKTELEAAIKKTQNTGKYEY